VSCTVGTTECLYNAGNVKIEVLAFMSRFELDKLNDNDFVCVVDCNNTNMRVQAKYLEW